MFLSAYIYIGPYGICGDQCYDYNKERCCNGAVLKAKGSQYCCGDSLYDFTKQTCCGGVAFKRSKKSYTYCCGNTTYDYYKEVCCIGGVPQKGNPSHNPVVVQLSMIT